MKLKLIAVTLGVFATTGALVIEASGMGFASQSHELRGPASTTVATAIPEKDSGSDQAGVDNDADRKALQQPLAEDESGIDSDGMRKEFQNQLAEDEAGVDYDETRKAFQLIAEDESGESGVDHDTLRQEFQRATA
jgi:hypothetical protein